MFLTGSRGPHGPDLPSPFGRKFQLLVQSDLLVVILSFSLAISALDMCTISNTLFGPATNKPKV